MSPTKANVDSNSIMQEPNNTTSLVFSLQENNKKEDATKKSVDFQIIKPEDYKSKVLEEKLKIEAPLEEELLGSVTTLSSPAVRTSARVIQKMKMDSIRPASPPPIPKDLGKNDHSTQKTPVQVKPVKVIWTNIERNLFFEAINEFGKDFDAISHYINLKQKRKNAVDPTYKTKDHVRLLYYQTFHKVTKYLRFSEDIKKHAQELYALINYGEMRKKLVFINPKTWVKLKELVYKGSVTVRVKGKNIRIKTPSCKALRKLNQLEEWQEEIKLPPKVEVYLKPANIDAWGKVQSLAQNPRVKTILPLQKRLLSLLKTFQMRWRTREAKLCDQTMALQSHIQQPQTKHSAADAKNVLDAEAVNSILEQEPILCFAPPATAVIHRPMVNLTEFLSSYSICLNSYEDRIGVSVKGEQLCTDRLNSLKDIIRTNSKRQRHDSGDKRSPEYKRTKSENDTKLLDKKIDSTLMIIDKNTPNDNGQGVDIKTEGVYPKLTRSTAFQIEGVSQMDFLADESHIKNEIAMLAKQIMNECVTDTPGQASESDSSMVLKVCSNDLKEVIEIKSETVIIDSNNRHNVEKQQAEHQMPQHQKPKKKEAKPQANKKKDTHKKEPFRPLLNEEIIRKIKMGWNSRDVGDLTIGDLYIMFGQDFKVHLEYNWVDQARKVEISPLFTQSAENVKTEVKIETDIPVTTATKNNLGNKLKQLLLLANMTEKNKRRPNCSCGHFCERGGLKPKNKDEVFPRSFISNKIYPSSHNDNGLFRQPVLPLRSGVSHIESYRLNLSHSRNKQSRWIKSRNARPSKQVVVQRLLPLQPGITHSYDVVTTTQVDFIKNSMVTSDLSTLKFKGNESNNYQTNNTTSHSNNNDEQQSKGNGHSSKHPPTVNYSKVDKKSVTEKTGNRSKEPVSTDKAVGDEEDPGIQSLMDISLPSPASPRANIDEYFTYNNNPPMSPMTILRQSPTDPKWFDENINDFSLSSFLGHLESACDVDKKSRSPHEEIESSNLSTISETSVDYMSKFEELAQSMINQEKK